MRASSVQSLYLKATGCECGRSRRAPRMDRPRGRAPLRERWWLHRHSVARRRGRRLDKERLNKIEHGTAAAGKDRRDRLNGAWRCNVVTPALRWVLGLRGNVLISSNLSSRVGARILPGRCHSESMH